MTSTSRKGKNQACSHCKWAADAKEFKCSSPVCVNYEPAVGSDPGGIDQHAPGAKLDAGKPDLSLLTLMGDALAEVALVGTMGAEKYTRGGFLEVAEGRTRYTAAMLRHLFKEEEEKFDRDPWYDTEAGKKWKDKIRHDAQVAWNSLARLQITLNEERRNGTE